MCALAHDESWETTCDLTLSTGGQLGEGTKGLLHMKEPHT